MKTACRQNILYKAAAGCLFITGSLLLAGCTRQQEEPYAPTVTALELHEDGTLTETIIDELDQSWYSAAELETMISETTASFNSQNGDGSVTVDNVSILDGQVQVSLMYAGAGEYAAYNNITFYAGSMLGAQMEEYHFDTSFRKVSKGTVSQDTITSEEPLSHKEYQVLIGDASHEYRVPGSIVYISADAVTADAYTVHAAAEDIAIVGTDADSNVTSSAGAEENGLIYIIYDF